MQRNDEYYHNYTCNDFLQDDDFLQWVKNPNREDVRYWTELIISIPEKSKDIEEAIEMVKILNSPILLQDSERKQKVWDRIKLNTNQFSQSTNKEKPVIALWLKWSSVAAIFLVVLIVGALFLTNKSKLKDLSSINAIVPGRYAATLTITGSASIPLSTNIQKSIGVYNGISLLENKSGELIYVVKGPVVEEKEFMQHTLSTKGGQMYVLTLPDRSKIYLNAASKLSYSPVLIAKGQRTVRLDGEAYFEIAKDAKHPFKVETNHQTIQVLGTHFNVNAYNDEPIVTTSLLEGSIKIKVDSLEELLKPGEQALASVNKIAIKEEDVANAIDWKNGDFYFDHMDFRAAMRKIARWYDVSIVYENNVPTDIASGGWISRNKPLAQVLNSIESTGLVKFTVKNRTIYIHK